MKPNHPLRVLTLNTHKGFSTFNRRFVLHELREAIREVDADLVFLQEVHGKHEAKAKRHASWPAAAQYEFLADQIWSDYAYGRNAVYPHGDHGNALLSKFPIESAKHIDLTHSRLEPKGFLHSVVRWREVPLHCLCVHLGLLGRHRKRQMTVLQDYIRRAIPPSDPLIIAGDFNDWTNRAHHHFAEPLQLIEAFNDHNGKLAKSFPSYLPILRLDRIYLRGLRPMHSTVLSDGHWSELSDHVGLMTDVFLYAEVDSRK